MLDTLRDISTALVDTHLNMLAFRTNENMKILTILATFMLPLTLITSWYGMNFDHMIGLTWRYAELAVLGLFGIVCLSMGLVLRRKGWL